ncbi:hypothetical protein CLV78_105192 [Aliiruegeria haliotis]|uniref:Tat pathway signal sequence domain protein n=1 Tax=Aliiruegeria haliotis TaxID=1280846 RepID=A0A2T0RPV8_9RHOB|nr:hypothetical protein [Aliiruegeria haliotis]PRY23140.1 hypothetical protein CLV78_105192 [Aliiruegeria haliotis]
MSFRLFALTTVLAGVLPALAQAQSAEDTPRTLHLELNALQDVGGACRLTFMARNGTGMTIEKVVFEAVVFDQSGGVVNLSLFDFRELPADRPRVRQFDLPDRSCESIGQALINGANTCRVDGAESDICDASLSLGSRLSVELLG